VVTTAPRLSIVVEWANTDRAGVARSATMLREVERQIEEIAAAGAAVPFALPVEILIVQSDGTTTAPPVVDALARESTGSFVERTVLTAPPTGYYGLKNHGFAKSRGDIVIFIDSDVIPEGCWLKSMLAPLDDAAVEVVAGRAYIAPGGVYHKAFALFWFFPLRLETDDHPTAPLFANNLAFRRATFARFLFEVDDRSSRGACLTLAARLGDAGVTVRRAPGARVSHPPPNGLHHFVARGLAQGRDRLLRAQQAGAAGESRFVASGERAIRNIGRSLVRIASKRREVNLSLLEAPVAAGVAVSYYSLYFTGEMLTRVSPDFMIRRFRV
jgi:glycosyltransferase involved in cell wall biosynthesis